jgi:hypothetical protein
MTPRRVAAPMLAIAVLAGSAAADPAQFTGDFQGTEKVLRFGRLLITEEGSHLLVLTEDAHPCREQALTGGYSVVVVFRDAAWKDVSLIGFNLPTVSYSTHGTVVFASLKRRRAKGRIEAVPEHGVGGSGTFNVAVCRKPVKT